MIWYWYVTRPDELMLDIDGGRGGSILGACRLRLEAAIRSGKLAVRDDMFLYRSGQPGHYHVIIRLKEPMSAWRRFIWEMQLRSDLYRGRCNLMRYVNSIESGESLTRGLYMVGAPALLISPKPWTGFYREPDVDCSCPSKHNFKVFSSCPAARALRGKEAANEGYFGELLKGRIVPKLKVKEGRMSTALFAYSEEAGKFDNGV